VVVRPYPSYQPIPAPLPQLADKAGRVLCEWAAGVQERPLGLFDGPSVAPAGQVRHLVVTTDLVIAAWRQLFPAERMLFVAGRKDGDGVRATSIRDVTGDSRSRAHVKASPAALCEALLDWQASGAHVVAWIHSHPGLGALASHPSAIDDRQDRDLRETYGGVIGMIVTQDGWLRVWGSAVAEGIRVDFRGRGVVPTDVAHVYRLAVR
jgi:proteasome lid subunit RPN8/RPN11